jgi:hypothetical protein
MDWHGILQTAFLVAFWVGLLLTLASAVLSGAFQHEFGSGSAFEGGHAGDLGGTDVETGQFHSGEATVGWTDAQFPGASPLSPTVICSALTGIGGIGYLALKEWEFGVGGAVALALFSGLALGAAVFVALAWMFKNLQATSHVTATAQVGRKAMVTTTIQSGHAGAISFEAAGSRLTAPARAVDAAEVPEGAEVEIRRLDGPIYVVEETKESWTRRGRAKPGTERWS